MMKGLMKKSGAKTAFALAMLAISATPSYAQSPATLGEYLPKNIRKAELYANTTIFYSAAPFYLNDTDSKGIPNINKVHIPLENREAQAALARLQGVRVKDIQPVSTCADTMNPKTLWLLTDAAGQTTTLVSDYPAMPPDSNAGSDSAYHYYCVQQGDQAYRLQASLDDMWQAAQPVIPKE